MIFKCILKIISAKRRFGINSKTLETHSSCLLNDRQETDPMNVPTGIETMHSDRLGFMVGEGRVPDNFNTMGSKEIENLFLNDR
jgi:hypothetical protein